MSYAKCPYCGAPSRIMQRLEGGVDLRRCRAGGGGHKFRVRGAGTNIEHLDGPKPHPAEGLSDDDGDGAPSTADYSVAEIQDMAPNWDLNTALAARAEEEASKGRVTALRAIQARLDDLAAE